jgi:hypothetical protein
VSSCGRDTYVPSALESRAPEMASHIRACASNVTFQGEKQALVAWSQRLLGTGRPAGKRLLKYALCPNLRTASLVCFRVVCLLIVTPSGLYRARVQSFWEVSTSTGWTHRHAPFPAALTRCR